MSFMKEKIEQEIRDLEETYDYYLEKTEEYYNKSNTLKYYEERIHDLYIEICIYKKVLEMINKEVTMNQERGVR